MGLIKAALGSAGLLGPPPPPPRRLSPVSGALGMLHAELGATAQPIFAARHPTDRTGGG